ncbi:hypothetical protein [Alicyclobacillus ferrooxydans]|uniref:Uncharacterized protein n=1 Tax=Alicyclobacillus ferrooxydans TaxID=471514 RepID=A0A0P9D4U4_9BACL|nr:hypothetical protein [Alicyclobacillus ferrooxydans]KPV44464.1 hypothetical protein AN477_07630 [Alicyclobacillus ferrooxydans]
MGELTALTLMDLATLASAIGTLGLAITSWYQMRRSRRDSLHPLVYAESAWVDTGVVNTGCPILSSVRINLKNYGTGPALDLKFMVRGTVGEREPSDVRSAMHTVPIHAVLKAGQSVPYMNLAPNQEVSVELALEASAIGPRADGPVVIEVHYRSVFRQHLHRAFTVECLGGLASITNVDGSR